MAGGLLFFGHGLPKLLAWRERAPTFADPIGLGPVAGFWLVVFAEVACSALVAAGWLTRFACVFLVGFLTIAGFVQHAADPFKVKELAFVYLAPFLCLLWTGPGRFSIDSRLE
jgi:putative oxidoreductase